MKIITRLLSLALVVVCGGSIWSTNASAQGAVQASIAGVVRDTSGAVLPGVTIEASSPVLIEKSRTAVSDATGRYRIIALNPGSYTVTFTLAGFSTVRREGIELTGSLTATIDAEMRVGSLEETLTVTGESPIVDVQSIKQQRVIDDEAIHSIPGQRVVSQPRRAGARAVGRQHTERGRHQWPRPVERRRSRWRQLGRSIQCGRSRRERNERRWHALRHRHAERLGSLHRCHGRVGRSRSRRAGDQCRAADWRQHLQRLGVPGRSEWLAAGRQLRRRAGGRRVARTREAEKAVERERRARRADREGPSLVLPDRPLSADRPLCGRHVLQQERRQPELVGVRP